MSPEELLAAYDSRRAAIAARLDAGDSDEAVKNDIVALFKEAEAAIDQLTAFKETIRELVQRYKSLAGERRRRAGGRPLRWRTTSAAPRTSSADGRPSPAATRAAR